MEGTDIVFWLVVVGLVLGAMYAITRVAAIAHEPVWTASGPVARTTPSVSVTPVAGALAAFNTTQAQQATGPFGVGLHG